MNTLINKAALAAFIFLSVSAFAQDENDLTYFLTAGKQDASKLIGAYLDPAITGMSYGFNGGWYSTAKTHKTFGFDLGVAINGVFIPSSDGYFKPQDLKLQTITSFTSTSPNGLAPTIMGPNVETRYTVTESQSGQQTSFNGPRGVDFKETLKFSGVASPTASLGIGIYKNTDLKIRWTPEIKYSTTKIKAFGLGVMHDFKQHIPGMKILPFDMSVLIAYTKITGSTGMANIFAPSPNDRRPQELKYDMNAWLYEVLISKKLAIFTFYGGVGFNSGKTKADVKGSYIIPGTTVPMVDPVALSFNNKSVRASAGIRMNLGPIYLNGEYTLQKYSMLTVGLGVSIREVKIY